MCVYLKRRTNDNGFSRVYIIIIIIIVIRTCNVFNGGVRRNEYGKIKTVNNYVREEEREAIVETMVVFDENVFGSNERTGEYFDRSEK